MELAEQSKVNLVHGVRLKTLEGMREVFWSMSEQRDGYSLTTETIGRGGWPRESGFRNMRSLYKSTDSLTWRMMRIIK